MFARNYGERGAAIREMPCTVYQASDPPDLACYGPVQAAHVIARGMGGCTSDRRSLVPLCMEHHRQQGNIGILSFQALYRVNLDVEAERIAIELDGRDLP